MAQAVSQAVKPGLAVYDSDSTMVGYVDQIDHENGWMKVEERPLGLTALWIPYRLVTTADPREVFVAATRNELRDRYASPPPRTTVLSHAHGRTTATTTISSGYDNSSVQVASVDVDEAKTLVEPGFRVLTADGVDLGKTRKFDVATGFIHIEKAAPWRRGLLIPVTLVANIDRSGNEITLVVNEADILRYHRLAPVDVVMIP
jgi:hypothetical protein